MTLVWRPGFSGLTDADAIAYVSAVETADGQPLEFGVAKAINDFVVGCKLDGTWSAIKASCILAGARTTNGALIPLVGTAPTPSNFDLVGDTDYDRKTGLRGGGGKSLNCNRLSNQDPQNNHHLSIYAGSTTVSSFLIGASGTTGQGDSFILVVPNTSWPFRSRITDYISSEYGTRTLVGRSGFIGYSRANGSAFTTRVAGTNETITSTSIAAPANSNSVCTGATRTSFYSIGESLDLARLDTRVTALITAIGAAIP